LDAGGHLADYNPNPSWHVLDDSNLPPEQSVLVGMRKPGP
jgi:hypothetical protein